MKNNADLTKGADRELSSHAASMSPIKDGRAVIGGDGPELDNQGTDQVEAAQILRSLRDNAFEGSDEKLALSLGRPIEEMQRWISGDGSIDGDVVLKAKAMAAERGVSLE